MSQLLVSLPSNFPGGFVQTLTGNDGIHVPPTAGNINVVGDGTYITTSGDIPTSTLTINLINGGSYAVTFDGDYSTSATPSAGVINFTGAPTIQGTGAFYASGNTLTYQIPNAVQSIGIGTGALGQTSALSSGSNIAIGTNCLYALTGSAAPNIAIGTNALAVTTGGVNNVAIGIQSLTNLHNDNAHGYNTALGVSTGTNYTGNESYNIILGNSIPGVLGESNVLRIGVPDPALTPAAVITSAYIGGIYGVSPSSPQMVIINSSNQLGSQAIPSSSISITGDSGGPLTGNAFTFTGGSTGLVFNGGGTTETLAGTLAIANGGTDATSFSTSTGIVKYDGTRLVTSSTALIDSSNIQTNTGQPAFFAYLSATQTNATGDSTDALLLFDTVAFDNTSSFNTGTHTYTFPKTGVYSLSLSSYLVGVGAQTFAYAYINVNSSALIYFMDCNPLALKDANNAVLLASPIIYKFNSGDTINIHCAVIGASKTISFPGGIGGFTFAGVLMC